jgi:hypothetical protein
VQMAEFGVQLCHAFLKSPTLRTMVSYCGCIAPNSTPACIRWLADERILHRNLSAYSQQNFQHEQNATLHHGSGDFSTTRPA